MLAALDKGEEPNHYRDAILLSSEAPEWMEACTKEYDSLIKTGTLSYCLQIALSSNQGGVEFGYATIRRGN